MISNATRNPDQTSFSFVMMVSGKQSIPGHGSHLNRHFETSECNQPGYRSGDRRTKPATNHTVIFSISRATTIFFRLIVATIAMLSNPGQNENRVSNSSADCRLIAAIEANFPGNRWGNGPIGVAVSGGADSVALAAAIVEYAKRQKLDLTRIHLFHINHHQRGEDSDGDEAQVQTLAKSMGIPFVCFQDRSVQPGSPGAEADLRKVRYQFFQQWAGQSGARCIAMAHHQGDDAETILFRIFRGTGLNGLQGIPLTRPLSDTLTIVRPFLHIRRDEILQFIESRQLGFRHDSSNEDSRFSRNWIRNELLPQLEKEFGPGLQQRICGLGQNAGEVFCALNDATYSLFQRCIVSEDEYSIEIDPRAMQSDSSSLLKHWLVNIWVRKNWRAREMNRERWELLARFIRSTDPRRIELPASSATRMPGGIVRIQHSR